MPSLCRPPDFGPKPDKVEPLTGHENFGVAPVNFIGSGFGSGVVSAIGSVACSVAGGVSIAVSIADVAGTADDDEGGGARSSSTIVPLALEWILLPDPVSVVVI